MIAAALLVLTAGVVFAGMLVRRELAAARRETTLQAMLQLFGTAAAATESPRQLLSWYPIATAARRVFPDAFRELDQAAGGRFPFGKTHLEGAHARCTSDWLAWERAHDTEYKLRAASIEQEIEARHEPPSLARARLGDLEREKLERYQQRYEEYVKTAKALQALDVDEGAR